MFRVPVIDIYVTGSCNLQCPYCFGEASNRSGMARDTLIQVLNFAHFTGADVIEFCGGEPLLYHDLDWAVNNVRAKGFELILRTNGLLIPERRSFIAENFRVVGISLDGDAENNHRMRPFKRRHHMSARAKFEIPLREIVALKSLNANLFIILASVATAKNIIGILSLGQILLERKLPIDLWKIYQFVPNSFRASVNQDRFKLSIEEFVSLQRDVQALIGGRFPLSCHKSHEIDGNCLVINRDGDVLLGARQFGNIMSDNFEDICCRLESEGAEIKIYKNKFTTYRTIIPREPI